MGEEITGRKLVFISRSDMRGGAAIVTYRLVEVLRKMGHDARMLVCEKHSDADFVKLCANRFQIQFSFLIERLKVYLYNGRNKKTLFKIDPATNGLPLWKHPWLKNADAIFLGWVNQGMLSLQGVGNICRIGVPVIWIMHDMWNMTGVCHHAGNCTGFLHSCGDCPLLGDKAGINDLSRRIWEYKGTIYRHTNLKFVAVSKWLAEKAMESRRMRNLDVRVIPNAFDVDDFETTNPSTTDETSQRNYEKNGKLRIIFGGARVDDPIKGLDVLKKSLSILQARYRDVAKDLELTTFGEFKLPDSKNGFVIPHTHLGVLKDKDALQRAYSQSDIVISTSDYETLPGTLIEGQASGCIPVATLHGGQGDIIEHRKTGWLASWNDAPAIRAESIAEGIAWAYRICKSDKIEEFKANMRASVKSKFEATKVARQILKLID